MRNQMEIVSRMKRYEITIKNIAVSDVVSDAWFRGALEMLRWVMGESDAPVVALSATTDPRDEVATLRAQLAAAQARVAALAAEIEWSRS